MSVTYDSAMATLTTMFPSMDRDYINDVLHQKKGHMENTVEYLLSVTPQQQLQHTDGNTSNTVLSQAVSNMLSDSFLRPPSYFEGDSTSRQNSANHIPTNQTDVDKQIQSDLALAQLLQNEQFMLDLANNPQRYTGSSNTIPGQSNTSGSSTPTRQSSITDSYDSIGDRRLSFSSRWDMLTAQAKNKLSLMAEKLKRNKIINGSNQSLLPTSNTNNYTVLPSIDDQLQNNIRSDEMSNIDDSDFQLNHVENQNDTFDDLFNRNTANFNNNNQHTEQNKFSVNDSDDESELKTVEDI